MRRYGLEHALLAAILKVDEPYAVPLRVDASKRLRRRVARGALYVTLSRLEKKGWIRSRMGEPLPVRGGRRRRYYSVTRSGLAALRSATEQARLTWIELAAVLGGRG